MDHKFIFSGKLRSGKDYCAEAINAQILSFSQPIVTIAKELLGSVNKEELRSRRLLQLIGAWGRGITEVDQSELEKLDLPSRAVVLNLVKTKGVELFPNIAVSELESFGNNPNIWIEITKAKVLNMSGKMAIVNSRFPNELETFSKIGFKHFHVKCSEETRRTRPGAGLGENDTTEAMAKMYDKILNGANVIWNDTVPIPEGKKYLSVQAFKSQYLK